MGKAGRFRMNMRVGFLAAVGIAVIALIVVLVVLVIFDLPSALSPEEVSFYNLLVDIIVGFFTIVGLFWAASEFAKAQVKPDLRLVIGRLAADLQGIDPLTDGTDALIGLDDGHGENVSLVVAGLFLENAQPKAARHVRVNIYVRDVPRPKHFIPWRDSFKYEVRDTVIWGEAVLLQFEEDLVVYEGAGVYLGKILVGWSQGTHPERITFVARLYSLEGAPKEVTVSHPIHWIEKEATSELPRSLPEMRTSIKP